MESAVVKAINKQINAEFYSAFLYLAMSARASELGLDGVANWLYVQFQEENAHALIFFQYLDRVSAPIALDTLEAPPSKYKNATEIFEAALEHEKVVTGMINNLVALAREHKDFATDAMLQWFVTEQVEEEENATTIIAKLKLAGEGSGLFMVDRELAMRTYTPPAPLVTGTGATAAGA